MDSGIKEKSDDAQDQDTGNDHIQLKDLGAVNDQVAKTTSCCQEFSDDNAYQGQTDIDFGGTYQSRKGGGEDNFVEGLSFVASQRIDQGELLRIYLPKGGIKADNGAKDRNGDPRHNDGGHAGSQPDDEKRRKGGFGKAV